MDDLVLVDRLKAVYRTHNLQWLHHCDSLDRLPARLSHRKRPILTLATTVPAEPTAGPSAPEPLPAGLPPAAVVLPSNSAAPPAPSRSTRRNTMSTHYGVGDAVADADIPALAADLQTEDEKHPNVRALKTVAAIPDMALTDEQRRPLIDHHHHTLVADSISFYDLHPAAPSTAPSAWTAQETQLFEASYLAKPKQFGFIASQVRTKSRAECVLYYYRTKCEKKYRNLHPNSYSSNAPDSKPREMKPKRPRKGVSKAVISTTLASQSKAAPSAAISSQPKPRTKLSPTNLSPASAPQPEIEQVPSRAPTPSEHPVDLQESANASDATYPPPGQPSPSSGQPQAQEVPLENLGPEPVDLSRPSLGPPLPPSLHSITSSILNPLPSPAARHTDPSEPMLPPKVYNPVHPSHQPSSSSRRPSPEPLRLNSPASVLRGPAPSQSAPSPILPQRHIPSISVPSKDPRDTRSPVFDRPVYSQPGSRFDEAPPIKPTSRKRKLEEPDSGPTSRRLARDFSEVELPELVHSQQQQPRASFNEERAAELSRAQSPASGPESTSMRRAATSSYWTKDERLAFQQSIELFGPDFTEIAHRVSTKSQVQCRNYYQNNKQKLSTATLQAVSNTSSQDEASAEAPIPASQSCMQIRNLLNDEAAGPLLDANSWFDDEVQEDPPPPHPPKDLPAPNASITHEPARPGPRPIAHAPRSNGYYNTNRWTPAPDHTLTNDERFADPPSPPHIHSLSIHHPRPPHRATLPTHLAIPHEPSSPRHSPSHMSHSWGPSHHTLHHHHQHIEPWPRSAPGFVRETYPVGLMQPHPDHQPPDAAFNTNLPRNPPPPPPPYGPSRPPPRYHPFR